jgi:hypothetical protein
MIRLLFLAAAPTTSTRERLAHEAREITQRLRASRHGDQIQTFLEWAARPADLQQVLLRARPHIVHFLGPRGQGAEDVILLEDERGQPVRLGEQALGDLFRFLGEDIRLVVLNACYSTSQANVLLDSVDAVLGAPARLDDVSALTFMEAFYQALSFGLSVSRAFDLAGNSLALESLPSWSDMPALLLRPGIDPETITFVMEPDDAPQSAAPSRSVRKPNRARSSSVATAVTAGHDAPQFFQDAGFVLGSMEEQRSFFCFPRTALWQEAIRGGAYVRIFNGRPLDGNDVIEIRDAARRTSPTVEVAFVVVDKPIDEPTWMQIAALRATSFNVVPIPYSLILEALTKDGRDRAASILSKHLERFLGRRADPYNVRHPVFDVLNFFGREGLAEELMHLLSTGQPLGLFGLRKMGKSSLLGYLRGRLPYPAALLDLQTGTALADLYERILRAWEDDARARLEIDLGLGEARIRTADPTYDFVQATKDTLSKLTLKQPDARLVILLDEIELLVPPVDDAGEALGRYLSFTRALRGLIQEEQRLSLMIVGVDPTINRISRCGAAGDQNSFFSFVQEILMRRLISSRSQSAQNPFFSFVQEIYIPPLLEADCIQMVRNIGRQVVLSYEDDAALRVARASGGHPSLARQLCSLMFEQRDRRPGEVTLSDVEAAEETFLFDPQYAAAINETGLWGELTRGPLWSEKASLANEAILFALARADGPVPERDLLGEGAPAARRASLAVLEQLCVIRRGGGDAAPRRGSYELSFGLFRAWVRRVLLGLEG